jgi:large subunit ribosomal protein L4
MAIPTYTKSGSKATTAAELDMTVFGIEPKNHELLKQAYQTYIANGRENHSKTLRRGEVRGGGRKPWKQKGTGRARFGSIRVPIWRGGGITFGPLGIENYTKKINTASKRTAIRQALTLKANDGKITVIETFDCKNGKTSETVSFLKKIGASRKVLLVVSVKDELVLRSTNNLQNVKAVQAMYLNVFDIMNADTIVIEKKSLDMVHEWLSKSPANKSSAAKPVTKAAKESK